MRLLDVSAVLDRERVIRQAGSETKVLEQLDGEAAKYAILSHRWGTEVDYDEMTGLMKMDEHNRDKVRQRDGYRKIIKSCEQAKEDGYTWLWIDTCCIDKRSSAELSEAINSMYRWYCNADICYVYLNDVDGSALPTEQDFIRFGRSNGWPEWFSRGWTLQELIAPTELEFFNKNWVSIGTKQNLAFTLQDITRIPRGGLKGGKTLNSINSRMRPSVAQIMSWAADRKTTRVEDRAYSLMGLFGVNMPMVYGEGPKAFQRLQLEIIRVTCDHSIFAWNPKGQGSKGLGSMLAGDPSCFRGCHDIENVYDRGFVRKIGADMRRDIPGRVIDWVKLLQLRRRMHSLQLSRWDVTNLGIQMSLPVLPCQPSPVSPDSYSKHFFRAILPCCDRHGNLVTIDLYSHGHSSYRQSWPRWITVLDTLPEFKSLYFAYIQDAVKSYHKFRLHDERASWHGFTRCGTFPCEIANNTITLSSQENTFIVLVYANSEVGSRFAVGFGYYLDQVWSHIVCDEHPAKQGTLSWVDFAKQVHDVLWSSPVHESYFHNGRTTIRDAHLPQTIWNARVFCHNDSTSYSDVMVGIEQCPGCCTGPREEIGISGYHPLWPPWTSYGEGSYELRLDGEVAMFDLCSSQEIALGDYGDSSDDNFIRRGNIFGDMPEYGIDSTDLVYRPVVSHVSSCENPPRSRRMQTQYEVSVTCSGGDTDTKCLVLYQPKGLSLPSNEEFELLLKAWSTRLLGKYLVTRVIQCSGFNRVNDEERGTNAGGDSTLDGGVRSADQSTFVSLYTVARPLAWYKEPRDTRRREDLKNIREHFYALASLHHLMGTDARQSVSQKWKTNGAVNFPALFGLDHVKHYIGEITFFQRLPSVVRTQLCSEGSAAGTAGGQQLTPVTRKLFERRPRFDVGQNTCNEVEAPLLLQKCKVLGAWSLDEERNTRREVESISQTLSIGLLEHIRTSFLNAPEDNDSRQTDRVHNTHYDVVNIRSTVQEIVALQTKLYATQDEDEQRALEEDITGKILWFCWCGVSSEVDQLLPKVLKHVRRKLDSMPPPLSPAMYGPRQGLHAIAEIIQNTPHADRGDRMVHLQRIMRDAGAGVSRHELWLTARAAERARWRRVLRDDPIVDTPGTGSSTGPEAPFASIAHQALDTGTKTL